MMLIYPCDSDTEVIEKNTILVLKYPLKHLPRDQMELFVHARACANTIAIVKEQDF